MITINQGVRVSFKEGIRTDWSVCSIQNTINGVFYILKPEVERLWFSESMFLKHRVGQWGCADNTTGLQFSGLSCCSGQEFFFFKLRYRVHTTTELKTKLKPCLTNCLGQGKTSLDLERQIKITHVWVDQRQLHFRERKQQHTTFGELQKGQKALLSKGNSTEGFYNPSNSESNLDGGKESTEEHLVADSSISSFCFRLY